jgi:uncharacterized protein
MVFFANYFNCLLRIFATSGGLMRGVICFALVLGVTLAATSMPRLQAAEFGTRDEAVAMVRRVQEKFKKDGPEATFRVINNGAFNDRDLYPFVHTIDGTLHVANGAWPGIRGKNLHDMRDQDGKFTTQDFMRIATTPPYRGWSDFRWRNPKTNTVDEKSAWIERMGDYLVGVGVYKDEQVNANTVELVSGSPSSDDTYLRMAYDLAAVLNDGDKFRVVPVVGIGGPQNIRDVRNLRGIDIGITQTSILNNFRRSNEQLGTFDNKIVYIAKLFNEEIHLVTGADISSIQQLRGRKVNLDMVGSGTNSSMRDIFRKLNIDVQEVNVEQIDAFEKLKRGEIAATVLIAGKPARWMSTLKAADGLHFVAIPYSNAIGTDYLPATLSHEDYPDMIRPGDTVDTIAVEAVLIAYNWPKSTERYRRVESFVQAFFSRLADFQHPPRHSKWREVSLGTTLPGWSRFEPAETWIKDGHRPAAGSDPQSPLKDFLASRGTASGSADPIDQNEQLFQEFLKWKRAREEAH